MGSRVRVSYAPPTKMKLEERNVFPAFLFVYAPEIINIVNYIYYSELIINFVFPYRWANDKTNENIKRQMRSRTANWFETTVRYERQTEDGQKKVNETYVVDALTFGEAEEVITKEMEPYVSGDFNVKSISPASYGEIFFSDNENDSHWYKAKLAFVVVDEKTAKEKRSNVNFLVQAASFNAAVKNIDESMGKTAIDYEIVNIADTKIMDVFEHNAPLKKEEKNDKPEFEG